MSDMKNENKPLDAEQQEQKEQTRVMQPVDASPRPQRRRRSDRYGEEEGGADKPEAAGTAADSEPAAAPRRETRVMQPVEAASRPMPPRPNVLNRVDQAAAQAAAGEEGASRRPMGTPPGFAPRRPVTMEQAESPRTRQTPASAPVRQMPVAGQVRKPVANDRGQNPGGRDKRKGHALLIGLVILLLIVGLVVVGVMLLGQNGDSPIGQVRNAVSGLLPGEEDSNATVTASGFTAANNRGTAPLMVMFNLTTSKSVEAVRLVDEDGNPLSATSDAVTENADSIIWVMNLSVDSGFEGLVLAQMYDGANWVDTGMSQVLEIAMPAPVATIDVAAFNETTDAPAPALTEEPVEEWTEEPAAVEVFTEHPAEEATDESTPTPTLAVSATPTVATAGTPTPAPAALAMTQAPIGTVNDGEEPEEDDLTGGEAPEEAFVPEEVPEDVITAAPTATPPLKGTAAANADPSLIRDTVIYNGNSKVDSYTREKTLNMPVGDDYITQPYGVLTYRGNAFRQNASVGNVDEDISELALAWTAEAGSVKGSSSTYYGIGWTGQAAIIKWSKEIREASNIVAAKKETSGLKEVIIAGMDGRIYFLDLADGQPTRDAINLGYPMRGTPSIHSLGWPIMTVGQYARKMASGTGGIGLRFYNLLTQKQDYIIDGLDGKSNRPYYEVGAFDTSALIDRNSDTLVAIGTNGMLYTANLKTEYSVMTNKVSINPSLVSMKSRTKGQAAKYTAVQSSPAMYGSYVYYADMQGVLRCVDTTTMTTVWAVETGDAVEAAIALDMDESGSLWLYTANTLENRSKGDCTIRRYDALTGAADWTFAVNLAKGKVTAGAMASPVIGQNELEDMVYYTISGISANGASALFGEGARAAAGALVAVSKQTGELVWAHELDAYSYSSPVAVYAEDGKGWIIQASSSGLITLLDGVTGDVVSTLRVEGTIDASPAVYNDTLVIGTTGKNTSFIYGIKIQ